MEALKRGGRFVKGVFKPKPSGQAVGPTQPERPDTSTALAARPSPPVDEAASRAIVGGVVNGIQAHNVQLQDTKMDVAGRDINNFITHHHYHELKDELKAIFAAVDNYRKIHQGTLAKATRGTIQWIFEGKIFQMFIDINGDLKILWGYGMPGAGKSIFASIVIDWLEKLAKDSTGQICVAYAYIRYSDQEKVTVQGILMTLVKQTIERHPDCAAVVQEAFAIHVREGTQPTEDELLSLLSQFCQQKKVTFYVLDALDEAPLKVRLKLLKMLSLTGARIFATSRPLPQLEAQFPNACLFPITANDRDLDLHIDEKIRESQDLQDLLDRSNAGFRERLTQTVKDNCGGMFLHASLQLDALQACFTEHAAMQTLEQFPPKIEDVYRQTWDRIVSPDAPHHATLAKAALAWVLNAKESLKIDQLRHALATCPETYHFEDGRLMPEATILAACGGLITVDKESELVRLVHYTAKVPLQELLLSSLLHPHSLLAAVCVTLLADRGFQNTKFTQWSELQLALEAEPLLAYAYNAWAFHAQESLDSILTKRLVSAFVADCCAFPMSNRPHYWGFDIGTPLHVVARYGFPLTFAGPYPAGAANVHSTILERTPLHLSCRWGHTAATQDLLWLSDIQVNLADSDGNTALILASYDGHEGSVKLLLAHPDIQVNLADSNGNTALILASYDGHEGSVKLLLAHLDIQVNLADSNGNTALILASKRGHEGSVKLLLAHPGIQVNLANNNGNTALMRASLGGHEGSVKLLLAHPDIQVNLADNNGNTVLIVASHGGHEGSVKLLLAHPDIQVNLADSDGNTALILASYHGHEGSVKLLLAHPDIQVDLADVRGSTALMDASKQGHEGSVKLLLAHPNIDVNLSNPHGSNPLLLASEYGHKNVVRLLLADPNIHVNAIDGDGDTVI